MNQVLERVTKVRSLEEGVSALGLVPHKVTNDWSQFNHHAARVAFVGVDDLGQQIFRLLKQGRGPKMLFTLHESINQINQDIRPEDKGDLYIISGPRASAFKFIPDRKEARHF